MGQTIEEKAAAEERIEEFLEWIKCRGGTMHPSIKVERFQGTNEGNGILATAEIPKDTTLFTLPRPNSSNSNSSLILNVQTSKLLAHFNKIQRKKIHKNWIPLLLVLLWERVRSILSQTNVSQSWAPYFNILPMEFDTLMFWNSDELAELKGSTILNKIGKEEAEEDYYKIVKPIIESRADLFPIPEGTRWEDHYGLSVYHRMGSLILSRSFHVEPCTPKTRTDDDDQDVSMDTAPSLVHSINDSNSLDEHIQDQFDNEDGNDDNDEDDDDDMIVDDVEDDDPSRESIEHIAMLPLADLLNAKSGCENAKLFYEVDCLKMKATKKINLGEQIYNTYGNPPNSDLLRRYGHVDDPNRFDVVEITIQTCLEVAHSFHSGSLTLDELKSRVEWALEMGLDEVFEIPTELERKSNGDALLPEELICILKILLLSKSDFLIHKSKEKLPKPKLNNPEILVLGQRLIDRRLEEYLTSIDEDERLLKELTLKNENKNHTQTENRRIKAIIVRKSEKEILLDVKNNLIQKLAKK